MIKHYDFHLPYFKQGDDLGGCIRHIAEERSIKEDEVRAQDAFISHAELLEYTAGILRKMAEHAERHPIKIEHADVHFISVSCEEKLGEVLCKEELLSPSQFDDEEDFED